LARHKPIANQTGHSVWEWPLVVVKELLDACEEAEVAPEITVIVEPDKILVEDNAGGIDAQTIGAVLDYTVRVSSREAYVSPTRGAQGNALKTILAMSYVLRTDADEAGVTVIETKGVAHRIEFRADHIDNQPKIIRTTAPSLISSGTRFTIHWPDPDYLDEERFKQLVKAYVWFNPHLTVRGVWFGEEFINVAATNPNWEKWRPSKPTSADWYDEARLQRYLAAHVARDRDMGESRTVRDFLREFRGLSGTALHHKILNEVGCSHQSLAAFFGVDKVNSAGITKLLAAMKRHSKPVAPKHLGVIGAEHFKERFLAAGGAVGTFKYQYRKGVTDDGIPYVVEFAFGLHQAGLRGGRMPREFFTGANWSARHHQPVPPFWENRRGIGEHSGQGPYRRRSAGDLRGAPCFGVYSPTGAKARSSSTTTRSSPMTTKRPRNIANDFIGCIETATAKWTKQKKSEERSPGNVRYRASRMTAESRTTQKDAAWQVMEAAYMAASDNDKLPASARQIYYQARPKIMALTDERNSPTDISRKPCCPTTSRSTASPGASCMTRVGISRSLTPTGASAAERSKSAVSGGHATTEGRCARI
jgi:hypothetical protein